jgi:DinB superfamily/Pentapeptide repeats (8 copies)
MPEEFEGDLTEAVFWGVDMSGARFRDVNFTGARISHAWVVDVDIDAFVDKLVVNGVDVTDYVNERDEWYPLRAMIRAFDPDGLRAGWAALEEAWAPTIARAQALGDEKAQESVNGEFSFVQTVRHLVMAIDKWFTSPILGEESFHPIGIPNTGSLDFPWPGLDYDLKPSLAEALAVRADRSQRFRAYLEDVDPTEFSREIEVLENGKVPLLECLQTVMEEEFWHNRYAQRDLAILEQGT